METITEEQFLSKLSSEIKSKFGSGAAFAKSIGVSSSFVSAVVCGTKAPNKDILEFIDAERIKETTFKYNIKDKGH